MNARRWWRWLAMVSLLALMLAACGDDDTDDAADTDADTEEPDEATEGDDADDAAADDDYDWPEMTLTFSSALPEGGLNLGFEWWADELEQRTDGAITTDRHYTASLIGAADTISAMADGTIEVGYHAAAYNPGEFPLWNVVGVPFQTDDPVAQARSLYELYEEHDEYRQEWDDNGVHLLLHQPLPHAATGLAEPADTVDDLDGRRLRMVGYVAAALEELGMETVAIDPAELYESIQRGVVDGYGGWPFDIIPQSALQEVAPYVYDLGMGHYASASIGMSKDFWDGLDREVQDLMTEIAEEFMFEAAIDQVMRMEEESCDAILDDGGTVIAYDDDQVAEIEQRVGTASVDRWREEAINNGLDEDVVDGFRDQWLEKYESYRGDVAYENGMVLCAERS